MVSRPATPQRMTRSVARQMQKEAEKKAETATHRHWAWKLYFSAIVGLIALTVVVLAMNYNSHSFHIFLRRAAFDFRKARRNLAIAMVDLYHLIKQGRFQVAFEELVEAAKGKYGKVVICLTAASCSSGFVALFVYLAVRGINGRVERPRRTRRRASAAHNAYDSGSDAVSEPENDAENEDEQTPCRLVGPNVVYVEQKLTPEQYKAETQSATHREVVDLLKSQEFRQLLKERGKAEGSFNWQARRSARIAAAKSPKT